MRVSDADRTEITNALCRHFAKGRLDEDEFNDRVAQATAAKTQADLGPLLADLPPLDAPPPAPSVAPPAWNCRHNPVWLVLGAILVLSLAWSVIGIAVSGLVHPHVPWVLVMIAVFVLFRRRRWHRWHENRL